MAKAVILDASTGLDEAGLATLEKKLGLALPADYRSFLSQQNGGRPVPECFSFLDDDGPYSDSLVDWFLSVGTDDPSDLLDYCSMYVEDERVPSHMLPIAHDPFGNLILLSLSGDDAGAIYFWDHENEGDADYSNLNYIGKNLDHFLERLFSFQG
ncbi:SMI1 / KNR4 family protein [Pseudovibrio axinellae]|uniref:SMI1 / KNR4 family protein n=1 Tax=Pseudovibrio axinellae TaxID=989403 RepID=A0A165VU36_9HYPH|nr:SMI1/KNR4 family protein [Pseudovibrio axinellae]KZL15445.1 SMI1 / KNR4 family protein [Pseudovibrio axinellae]SER88795.1 SMI1-KNR4 cell-wall [Pseudovibrio axinellae]